MGKLTIQEVAKVLVGRNGMDASAAHTFATEMFSLILERLQQGDQVKVKGLGTFKIIDVEARESVSVRTGERVVIDSHSKVSFTPDATMKELVNKPFSQFETVLLNEGVEFDDMEDKEPAEEVTDEVPLPLSAPIPTEVEESPVVLEVPVTPEVPVTNEVPVTDEAPVVEETPVVEEAPVAPEVPETSPLIEIPDDDSSRPWTKWLLGVLGVLALMAASAFGGYYYGSHQQSAAVADTVVVRDTVYVAELKDTIEVPQPETVAQPTQKEEPAPRKEAAPKAEPLDKYAQKDDRVRLGAYRIVGLDHEVTVRAGQTFLSICRANLGSGMECYVEAYNDLPRNPKVKEGQVIKIPKLQVKKRKKQTP